MIGLQIQYPHSARDFLTQPHSLGRSTRLPYPPHSARDIHAPAAWLSPGTAPSAPRSLLELSACKQSRAHHVQVTWPQEVGGVLPPTCPAAFLPRCLDVFCGSASCKDQRSILESITVTQRDPTVILQYPYSEPFCCTPPTIYRYPTMPLFATLTFTPYSTHLP